MVNTKIVILGFLWCLSQWVLAADPVASKSFSESELQGLSSITSVVFAAPGEVRLNQGNEVSLKIEADAASMDKVQVRVEKQRLFIELKKDLFSLLKDEALSVDLTMPRVEGVDIHGSGAVLAPTLEAENLALRVSGSGKFQLDKLVAEQVSVILSGSGEVNIGTFSGGDISVNQSGSGDVNIVSGGQVANQTIRLNGSGKYLAPTLKSQASSVNVSGSGVAELHVESQLEANISGSGSIVYHGSPAQLKTNASGSSEIRRAM